MTEVLLDHLDKQPGLCLNEMVALVQLPIWLVGLRRQCSTYSFASRMDEEADATESTGAEPTFASLLPTQTLQISITPASLC
jgi:hypothetical protein